MLEGQDVNLTEAQIEEAETTFSFKNALDKMFDRLLKESADLQSKEKRLWRKLEEITKEQFSDFDESKHTLSYSWNRKKLSIIPREKDEPGID